MERVSFRDGRPLKILQTKRCCDKAVVPLPGSRALDPPWFRILQKVNKIGFAWNATFYRTFLLDSFLTILLDRRHRNSETFWCLLFQRDNCSLLNILLCILRTNKNTTAQKSCPRWFGASKLCAFSSINHLSHRPASSENFINLLIGINCRINL